MIRRWKRASACMQRVVRGHIGRQAARRKRVVHTRVAMEGQRMWRGWVVRRWYKTVHAKRTAAATFIKSTWKRRRFRRLLLGQWLSLVRQEKARVEEEARLAAERAAALAKARQLGALTFQRVYRGWKGRRRFTFLRRLYDWTYRREQAVRRVRLDLAPRRSIHTCVRGTGHQDAEVVAYLFLCVQRSSPTAPGGHGGASSANGRGNCASAGVVRGGAERKDGWGYAMQRGPASCCARNADGAALPVEFKSFGAAVLQGLLLPKKTKRQRAAEAKQRRRLFLENGAVVTIQTFWRAVLLERAWEDWRMRMIAKLQVRACSCADYSLLACG